MTYSPEGQKRKPGRPSKAEIAARAEATPRQQEEKSRRRRRENLGEFRGLKLSVAEDAKDTDYEYRWINDDDARIKEKTEFDDWDIVTMDQLNGHSDPMRDTGEGTQIKRVVGTARHDGSAQHAYLCRKPREFHEEDERAKQAEIDAVEQDMRRAVPADPKGIEQDKAYVPGGTNTIRHGE